MLNTIVSIIVFENNCYILKKSIKFFGVYSILSIVVLIIVMAIV